MFLSGDGGEGLAECGEHRRERRQSADGDLGRARPERGERLPEQPRLQPRRHARQRGDVGHHPLGRRARPARRVRRRAGARALQALLEQAGPCGLAIAAEELGDEHPRLVASQPGARDDRRRRSLVVTWQLRQARRGARREEPESHVRLHGVV